MINEEKPLEAAASAAAKELTRQLYADVKSWLTGAGRWIKKKYGKVLTEVYSSPSELLDALKNNLVKDGDRVTLECKPALYGPFLRDHFLSPIIGNHTGMRLGPPLQHPNPVIGLMAQVTSQLTPVGLYPPIEDGVSQAVLYPSDTPACGFQSLIPVFGINELVQYIPALLASRHTNFCNVPCHITGIIRLIDSANLMESGFKPEIHEEMRQAGTVWFIDATDEDSECNPLGEGVTTELWGGLYASGHLEIASGTLKVERVLEGFRGALASAGYKPFVDQNQAGRKEIMIFAEGFRILMDSQLPYYSLHMDAELALDFKGSREKFDRVSLSALENIKKICGEDSVELINPLDFDFSYTNCAEAYSVMCSSGADNIKDPLMLAIRDWHRKRNVKIMSENNIR
jgi:hypothetical protein